MNFLSNVFLILAFCAEPFSKHDDKDKLLLEVSELN